MTHRDPTPFLRHGGAGRRIAGIALAAAFTAVALKWAWTKTAVVLFALPDASFAQAAAVVIAFAALLVLGRAILRPTGEPRAPAFPASESPTP